VRRIVRTLALRGNILNHVMVWIGEVESLDVAVEGQTLQNDRPRERAQSLYTRGSHFDVAVALLCHCFFHGLGNSHLARQLSG
jgi:hypothetical protein